ncbi:MAG: FAD-binding oxidoreductase, partial [Rhizomicrobium sp.]
MELPQPNADIIAHGADIIAALRTLVPDGVVGDSAGLAAFDGDALTAYRQKPLACVLPRNKDEVSAVLEFAAAHNIPIVPRGAGTSLSGGALPRADGILLSLTRMNRILEIDLDNRCVVTEPGVTNLAITRAVDALG